MAVKTHYTPYEVDDTFVRSMGFALGNLGETLVHNAKTLSETPARYDEEGYFERYVWSDSLTEGDIEKFDAQVRLEAGALIEKLNRWIAEREVDVSKGVTSNVGPRAGLGIYFFINERE